MTFLNKLRFTKQSLRRFKSDESGLATVEFALVLPMLAGLYLGFLQFAQMNAYNSRLGDTASTINDIITKVPQINASALDGAMLAGAAIGGTWGTGMQVRLVGIAVDENGNTEVIWSRSRNTSAPQPGTSYPLPANLRQEEGFVVTTETYYEMTWLPSEWSWVSGPQRFRYKYYHVPRSSDITDCVDCNQ